MLEIYTIYGGGMWKTALDAVVTLVGQNTFHTLLRIASTFGVLAVLLTFIKQRNPMVFVQWLAVFMILTSILLVPKRSVQVIDLSDPGAVWVTDNVPVGLAAIASDRCLAFAPAAVRRAGVGLARPPAAQTRCADLPL